MYFSVAAFYSSLFFSIAESIKTGESSHDIQASYWNIRRWSNSRKLIIVIVNYWKMLHSLDIFVCLFLTYLLIIVARLLSALCGYCEWIFTFYKVV